MARRAILFAAMLLFVSGCGDSTPATLTERGLKELRTGKYDQAITTCSKAINRNPQDSEAYLYRGRAYQFRNAMGDPARAIADFGEAIRLSPDSPDAYYSRAIVYRDLGQNDLAQADDRLARAADGHLQEVYRSLPDPPTLTNIVEVPPEVPPEVPTEVPTDKRPSLGSEASGDLLPKSEFEQREVYEQLKRRFEGGQPAADAMESPIERLNRLSRQPRKEPEDPLNPLGTLGQTPSVPQQGQPPLRLPEDSNASEQRPLRAAPTSPFQPPLPGGLSGEFDQPPQSRQTYRPLQSPFGQRSPAPTGFGVQPANPFGQQQQAPRSVRQQPPPSRDTRYSNPAVRPPNPRDYVP